jgi:ribosome biogenesis GTPase
LINRLLASEVQAVRDIRQDDRGRHTTTARRLFLLPQGGMLIDTPGMRELQLWDTGDGLGRVFEDIEWLARNCRFRDCRHTGEPGCEVQLALDENRLPHDRYESFLKLRREQSWLERKQDVMKRIEETRRWKQIHKAHRKFKKPRDE